MSQFKYIALAAELKHKIISNVWRAEERLPSIRVLSSEYQVSKVSVQNALHKLEANGLVKARSRSGYYVVAQDSSSPVLSQTTQKAPGLVTMPAVFHEIMARSAAFDIYPSGNVKAPSSHIQTLNRNINRAMRQQAARHALYYGSPKGDIALREQISQHYRGRDLFISAEEICITSGCQNSLFLALSSCCQPGDTVAIESPSFYGILQLLQTLKLNVIEIPASFSDGLPTQALEQAAQQWRIKACIVTPNFATPTGACMPQEEKRTLCRLAQKYEFTLIEDDIYGDLGFHFSTQPLKGLDQQNNVILCSSFSKSLSRDLRTGWIMGGKHHEAIVHLSMVNNLANNQAVQQGLARFISEGHFRRHLLQYRQTLEKQRNELINILRENWFVPFTYTTPSGGLALMVTFEQTVNCIHIYQEAIKEGIIPTPGNLFSTNDAFSNSMRLSFVHEISGKRLAAIKRLGQLVRSHV
ncbi:HTH-type transcriptional regulator NorG [Paraglaciecola mesophila]|uniref:HTH-type transcriptional regulator NorG n=1 Tax=Paraglaciecola mesophila TaxID=197222 RepID=A0A857JM23_9ALTE|nr:PLP-dependent aminotransferase family protein [Paraglaciecola mesophila]QHJ13119.1 HTH-type transcriptional regulator NorG [Paraglaciecola mesophila]